MPIVWNPKARSDLAPTRREDVAEYKPQKAAPIWERIHRYFQMRGKADPVATTFVDGRSKTSPELASLMEKCEPLIRSESPPVIDDVDVAAVFVTLVGKLAWAQAWDYVLASSASLPFAFEVRLRSYDFDALPKYVNWSDPFRLIAAADDSRVVDRDWRARLLSQPDAIRAECKQIAARFTAKPGLARRTTIAYTFFDLPLGDEVCREWIKVGVNRTAPLHALVRDFELAKELVALKDGEWEYFNLVERFGDLMLPTLVAFAEKPFDTYHARNVAEALALYDDPIAADAMVKLLGKAPSRPHAIAYFSKFPHHAESALAKMENAKGRAAKIGREVLEAAVRAHVGAVKPEDEAPLEDLPRILATPPWADENKPKKPTTKLALERAPLPESLDWHDDDEKARALTLFPRPEKPATPETLANYKEMRDAGKFVDVVKHKNEALPDELVLSAWLEGQKTYAGTLVQKAQFVFAKFGDAAFPGLAPFGPQLSGMWGDPGTFLLRVKSWRLALPFAALVTHRRVGKLAWLWLQRHSELAVLALVPVAFGDEKDDRVHAERALFRLKASGIDVVAIAARYGDQAKKAIEKLFAWDPVYDLPKTIPKLGPAWNAQSVSRPRLVSTGKALPVSALDAIATMLAISPIDPPYAGIAQIKETCEPHSLAEFSWETARTWEHAGHKKKEIWMLNSLVHFADDEIVRRLTPGMRVDYAVQVLEVIGTDAALMEMATIAGRTASQGSEWTLAGRIEKLLAVAAEERGVTKDELEEDLAPTSNLEEDGSLVLDFGPRKVVVGFDESLTPYVKNESGARGRALPPARKDDDPEKAERAKTIWRDLKEDVTVIAQRRIKALVHAMSTGRQWAIERFRRVWLDHRLMKHLARGVIWTDGKIPFRVAEDGTLSNVDDDAHTLAPDAKISVAHPLRMTKDEIEKWRTVLEDYKIVQPFMQVGREYPKLAPDVTRMPWADAKGTWGEVMPRLHASGFKQGAHIPGKYNYMRYVRGGSVHVEFTFEKSKLASACFVFKNGETEVPASKLDALEVADALYDLTAPE
jgi:hypothetical protein